MYKERMEICKKCDRLNIVLGTIYQCAECWCLLDIKARMASQECPLGKWERENNDILGEECGGCS